MKTEEWDHYNEEKPSLIQLNLKAKFEGFVISTEYVDCNRAVEDGLEVVTEVEKDPLDVGDQVAPVAESYNRHWSDECKDNSTNGTLCAAKFNSLETNPYGCSFCSYRGNRRAAIINHLKSHTGRTRVIELPTLEQHSIADSFCTDVSVADTIVKREDHPTKSSFLSGCGTSDSGYEDPEWPSKPSQKCLVKSKKLTVDHVNWRRKEINNKASLRYRERQKMKMDALTGVLEELTDKNQSLKRELLKLTSNVECLRKYVRAQFMDSYKSKNTSQRNMNISQPLEQKLEEP